MVIGRVIGSVGLTTIAGGGFVFGFWSAPLPVSLSVGPDVFAGAGRDTSGAALESNAASSACQCDHTQPTMARMPRSAISPSPKAIRRRTTVTGREGAGEA